jgi:hypothetical protein
MKTLTLSSESNDYKDGRRTEYAKRARSQDHGTRHNSDSRKDPSDLTLERRKAMAGNLALADSVDMNLSRMTTRQLERLATNVLRSNESTDEKPKISFLEDRDEIEEYDVWGYEADKLALEDPTSDLEDDYDVRTPMMISVAAKGEIVGRQRARRSQLANAERVYEGHVNPHDDTGDFTSGMHITTRP